MITDAKKILLDNYKEISHDTYIYDLCGVEIKRESCWRSLGFNGSISLLDAWFMTFESKTYKLWNIISREEVSGGSLKKKNGKKLTSVMTR